MSAPRWDPKEEEELRRLWASGLGQSAIARRMGMTRNAIIGKLNRMGLSSPRAKASPTSQASPRPRPQRYTPFRKAPEPKEIPLPEPEEEPSGGKPFAEREENECGWPMAPGFVCGGPVIERRKPYCAFHTRMARPKASEVKEVVTLARNRKSWLFSKRTTR